jgi:tetratricopeptide (TPR) repeat protein
MAESHDKKFEEMLFAYELGILSDEERRQLEMHLLDCEQCRDRIKEFDKASRLIKFDDMTMAAVNQIARGRFQPSDKKQATARFWRRLVPAVAAAAVLALLILQPWQVAIEPSGKAEAALNRLAIMYFDNPAQIGDSSNLGGMITNLLMTDLTELSSVQVVSGQRLYDILRLLGEQDKHAIDKDLATRVAERAQAKWMLLGSILQIEPEMVITWRLVEVTNGEVAASGRTSGKPQENLFTVVDRLSAEIKDNLSLPPGADEDFDPRLSSITTSSAEAYRHYVEGLENYYRAYYQEAIESFEKALEYDSTFAMAHYSLAITKDPAYINKAVRYSENTTGKERHYIKAMEAVVQGNIDSALTVFGKLIKRYPDEKEAYASLAQLSNRKEQFEKAVGYYRKAIELDSLYKSAYNELAYTYNTIGNLKGAISTIDKYIALAPDEPNPYDSKADILAANGKIDEAIESYKAALVRKDDFHSSLLGLGKLLLFRRDYAGAKKYFRKMLESKYGQNRSEGRYFLAFIPIYQGKINDALKILNDGIAADRLENIDGWNRARKHLLKSVISAELGKNDSALEELNTCMEIHQRTYPGEKVSSRHIYVQILAVTGQYERADKNAALLKEGLQANDMELTYYLYAEGTIEWAKNDYVEALSCFERAGRLSGDFNIHYMLGRAYLKAEEFTKAIEKFEEAKDRYDYWRSLFALWDVKLNYYLGLACERSGQNLRAAEHYQEFLKEWEDAEPEIEEINEAQIRLERLRNLL